MNKLLVLSVLSAFAFSGCATGPGASAVAATDDSGTAECNRRMVDEKVDLDSVAGKLRRDNCLEAMKLKPRLSKMSPEVIKTTLGFAECKADARTRNLPLAAHQDALFQCATRHGGPVASACLSEMIMGKVPVDALEMNMANCLQIKQGLPR